VDTIAEGIDYSAAVKCVEIGNGKTSSLFELIEAQVKTACRKLRNDPDFAGKKINIVGISQGGLIARSLVETCDLDVETLFTFGGPHQGVSDTTIPIKQWWISTPLDWLAGWADQFLIAELLFAPADYYRAWWNLDRFEESSIWLPKINNEKPGHYN
jgi:palmitoyl-protein thioesterase